MHLAPNVEIKRFYLKFHLQLHLKLNVYKINNVYHYQCIIKYKHDEKLSDVLKKIDDVYKINPKVDVSIDVNPIRV